MANYYERERIFKSFPSRVEDAVRTMELTDKKVKKIVNLFKEEFGEDWEKELKMFADSAFLSQSQYCKEKWYDARNEYFANVSAPLVEKFAITRDESDTSVFADIFVQFAHRSLIHEFFCAVLAIEMFSDYNKFLKEKQYVRMRDGKYIPYEYYKARNFIY